MASPYAADPAGERLAHEVVEEAEVAGLGRVLGDEAGALRALQRGPTRGSCRCRPPLRPARRAPARPARRWRRARASRRRRPPRSPAPCAGSTAVRRLARALSSRMSGQKRVATAARRWRPGLRASHASRASGRPRGRATGCPSASTTGSPMRRMRTSRATPDATADRVPLRPRVRRASAARPAPGPPGALRPTGPPGRRPRPGRTACRCTGGIPPWPWGARAPACRCGR